MFSPKLLDVAMRYQLAAVAVFSAVALALLPEVAAGTLAGGLLAAGNFWFLKLGVMRLMSGDRPRGGYILLLFLKFFFVVGAMALMVLVFGMHPLGLAAGLFTLFIGIGGATVHTMLTAENAST